MNDVVSIIIPVYNKEKYIKKCLLSIQQQTYTHLHIIIIDDGSTDNSVKIVKKMASNDQRIRVFESSHKGPGEARNIGLKNAVGRFIVFVDADDYLKNDYIEILMKYKKYDLVVSGIIGINNNTKKEEYSIKLRDDLIKISSCRDLENIINEKLYPIFAMDCTKLYKLDLIKNKKIYFSDALIGEDSLFVLKYLKYANEIKLIDYCGYINNIIPNTLSRRHIKNMWPMLLEVIRYANNELLINSNSRANNYLLLRAIKIALNNEIESFHSFKKVFDTICNEPEVSSLVVSLHANIKDKIFTFLFKRKKIKLIYIILKFKNRG